MKFHGWKKMIAVGMLVVFTWKGMAWANESPVAAPRNVSSISEKIFMELAPQADVSEDKLKKLIGLGVSANGLTVVSVDLAGDDWKKFVGDNGLLIKTLMNNGIFVADKNWRVLNGLEKNDRSRSYVSLYGVVFEIGNSKEKGISKHMISALNLTEKKFQDVTATLTNKDKSVFHGSVDIGVFIRLFAVVGMNDDVTLTDARIFLKDTFGIGLSENGKLVEDVVQYLRVHNVQGQEGFMMVTGQGYNAAQVGNTWYFGKSFDLVDAKTLLTDPQYAAMAKEILTNTKSHAQTVLNVVGSWIKLYSPKELTGASQDILSLLNYDASKLSPDGVELRFENGKVDLVPRTKGNGS